MSDALSHSGMEELLPAAALDILDDQDVARVQSHLRECAECSQLLDQYRQAVAAVALALPSQTLNPPQAERLRRRLQARTRSSPPTSTARPRARWGVVDRWSGWAVAAGLAGVLLVHHGLHRPLAYGWIVAGLATVALVGFGVYAMLQRRRVLDLERRVAEWDRCS